MIDPDNGAATVSDGGESWGSVLQGILKVGASSWAAGYAAKHNIPQPQGLYGPDGQPVVDGVAGGNGPPWVLIGVGAVALIAVVLLVRD